MHRLFPPALLLALLPACLPACPDDDDATAKERIFSAEEPPRAEQAAEDPIDGAALATNEEMRRRVLWMPASELRYRLGSFEATTKVSFRWSRGEQGVGLDEEAHLVQAADGDFAMDLENSEDFGLALRWVDGTAYVRNRHGAFFERRSDRAQHEIWREAAVGQLEAVWKLMKGRVRLVAQGRTTEAGRPAARYQVSLADAADPAATPPEPSPWALPPLYPEGGPDASLRNRLAVQEQGEPVALSGALTVDEATGAVLSARLVAELRVPSQDEGSDAARLELRVDRTLTGVGRAQTVELPEHQPFEPRPRAVKDPLEWWAPDDGAAGKTGDAAE